MSKRVFRGSLLAQRRTKQHGSGIEFSDHREYAPGDDLRYLDWNIYARHGDLLLKRFQEEQDLNVYIMLDCSSSMSVGKPAKFDLARQLAAALAYIALADLDRVAILAYCDGVVDEIPVTRGKAKILSVLQYLERLSIHPGTTHLEKATKGLVHRGSRTGLVVLLSDLFDENGFQRGLDQLRYRQFDTHVIQLHERNEARPSLLGDVEFIDMETKSERKVTVTEKNLERYRQLFEAHQNDVRTYCRTYGLGCTQSDTTPPFDELIIQMMRLSAATAAG